MTTRTVRISDATDYNVINARLPSGHLVALVIPSPTTTADRDWIKQCLELMVSEEERAEEERENAINDAFALAFPVDQETP